MEALPSGIALGLARRCGPFQVREIGYSAGFRQGRHAHALASVTLVLSGSIRETASSREEVGSALSVVVKPAGVEHADEVGPRGARTLQVVLGEAAGSELSGPGADMPRWRWLHGTGAARTMLRLLEVARLPACAPEPRLDDAILETLAALEEESPGAGEAPGWLRTVREALDDEPHLNRPVRELALLVGAHPVSLSRAFRRHYGCSITDYRRRQRLRRAASGIEAAQHEITRVAHQCGYADHPHLCRDFREATGLTPSRFRALARG